MPFLGHCYTLSSKYIFFKYKLHIDEKYLIFHQKIHISFENKLFLTANSSNCSVTLHLSLKHLTIIVCSQEGDNLYNPSTAMNSLSTATYSLSPLHCYQVAISRATRVNCLWRKIGKELFFKGKHNFLLKHTCYFFCKITPKFHLKSLSLCSVEFYFIFYQCYYPNTSRDSVSPVCGILIAVPCSIHRSLLVVARGGVLNLNFN